MTNQSLMNKLIRYIDAGFPILYINSFEENKADEIIQAAACGRSVLEWNGSNGYVDFTTKASFIENYSLVPFSNIVDLEKVFNREDLAKLEKQLKEIQKTSRFQLFIISTDDYFPNENITDYSFSILNNNSSDLFQKGNMIIVFNLKSREVRISTNKIAQNIISDEFSQKLIDEIIVPNFSEEKYFEGINEAIVKINEKIVAED